MAVRLAGREPLPSGEVRVTTNDSLLVHLLTPIFASFLRACPPCGSTSRSATRRSTFPSVTPTYAIRATDNPPANLVGRKAARIAWALYGAGEREPDGPRRWVTLGDVMGNICAWCAMSSAKPVRKASATASTRFRMAEAVEAGLGVGYLPCFVGDRRSGLHRLAAPDERFATDLWLLTHADLRQVRACGASRPSGRGTDTSRGP